MFPTKSYDNMIKAEEIYQQQLQWTPIKNVKLAFGYCFLKSMIICHYCYSKLQMLHAKIESSIGRVTATKRDESYFRGQLVERHF